MVDVALSRMSAEGPKVRDVVVADSCVRVDENLANGRAATLLFGENADTKEGDEDRNRMLDLEIIAIMVAIV